MKSCSQLPDGYSEFLTFNLKKNQRLAFGLNFLAVVIGFLMMLIGMNFVPINLCVIDIKSYLLKYGILFLGLFLFFIVHELIHGVVMKCFSKTKVNYGFSFLYAYAGSNAYFCKKHYIAIALAPVLVIGLILVILNFIVPISWFWIVYTFQIINVAGAIGDFYVTLKILTMPKDTLVKDTGVSMTFYSKQTY